MSNYGSLFEKEGRQVLIFEYEFPLRPEEVFPFVTTPEHFTQWYPYATGEMDLSVGGKIQFDDGEGSHYEAVVTELYPPYSFCFRELEDSININIQALKQGCTLTFSHTFDDRSMAVYTAAGWHRCLDVLCQIVSGRTVEWEDNAHFLREYYKSAFM